VNIPSTVGLSFPNDPIVFFVQPQQNQVVDQFAQANSRFSLRGVALDRNPVTDPGTQSAGAEHTGVDRVQIYLDGPRGTGTLLGNAGLAGGIGVNNKTGTPSKAPGACCFNTGGAAENTADFSLLGLGFGRQFELASFSLGWNPTTIPEGKHTVFAYARSSITGKESVASVDFILQRIHCSSIGGTC
jgi:hypothetical protein